MKNTQRLVLGIVLGGTLPGCGIVGVWETQQVGEFAPSDSAHFAPKRVTFSDDGTYAARVTYDGKETTNRGRYEWTGRRLIVTPRGSRSRTYVGGRWGDRLRLSAEYQDKTVHCTLTRVAD